MSSALSSQDIAIAALQVAGCELTPQNISVVEHAVDQMEGNSADALADVVAALNIRFASHGELSHNDE